MSELHLRKRTFGGIVKGRMTRGYAILMDIHDNKRRLNHTHKLRGILRLNPDKSWIMAKEHSLQRAPKSKKTTEPQFISLVYKGVFLMGKSKHNCNDG